MRITAHFILALCSFACSAHVETYSTQCLDAMLHSPSAFSDAMETLRTMPRLTHDSELIDLSTRSDDVRVANHDFRVYLARMDDTIVFYKVPQGHTRMHGKGELIKWAVWRCAVHALMSRMQQGLVAPKAAARMTLYYALRLGDLNAPHRPLERNRSAVIALRAVAAYRVIAPESQGDVALDAEAYVRFTCRLLRVLERMLAFSHSRKHSCCSYICGIERLLKQIPAQLPGRKAVPADDDASPAALGYISLVVAPLHERLPSEMLVEAAQPDTNIARIIIDYAKSKEYAPDARSSTAEIRALLPALPDITPQHVIAFERRYKYKIVGIILFAWLLTTALIVTVWPRYSFGG